MRIHLARSRRLSIVALLLAVAAAVAGIVAAIPARAAAPTAPSVDWTGGGGSDAPGDDPCDLSPCQGAKAPHTWSFSVTTANGLSTNDVVSFTFGSNKNDGLHAVALPVTMDPTKVTVKISGATPDCIDGTDATHVNPASVTVDWANQKFSLPIPGTVAAGFAVGFCFDDILDFGLPLTPTSGTDTYNITYGEPGGSVGLAYTVLARRASAANGQEVAPAFMHLTDAASKDLSNAGVAGTPLGVVGTTYNIILKGEALNTYKLSAESANGVADPRVTITCANPCTTDASGNLQASFNVSSGPDDHFVVVALCVFPLVGVPGQCDVNQNADAGVTGFTVTQPAVTAAAQPALPRAGQPPQSPMRWTLFALVGAAALAGIDLARKRGFLANESIWPRYRPKR